MDGARRGLYGCGWLREKSRDGSSSELRRSGKRGTRGARVRFSIGVCEHGLRVRREKDNTLRNVRYAQAHKRLRPHKNGWRGAAATDFSGGMYRADFLAR